MLPRVHRRPGERRRWERGAGREQDVDGEPFRFRECGTPRNGDEAYDESCISGRGISCVPWCTRRAFGVGRYSEREALGSLGYARVAELSCYSFSKFSAMRSFKFSGARVFRR